MLRLFSYLLGQKMATAKEICPPLDDASLGMPTVTSGPCEGIQCNACKDSCPTQAIQVLGQGDQGQVILDLGRCIGCTLCIETCPTGTIVSDKSTRLAVRKRQELLLTNLKEADNRTSSVNPASDLLFHNALAIRVVSTGCSACDMEVAATGNPVFDMERFGIEIVASPRFADALLVTGPVGRVMQDPLRRCFEAMPEPRRVIAAGTCAISGGVHAGGYAQANGVDEILPVDVFIPGCPPHPWTMLHGMLLAMGRLI